MTEIVHAVFRPPLRKAPRGQSMPSSIAIYRKHAAPEIFLRSACCGKTLNPAPWPTFPSNRTGQVTYGTSHG